MLLSGLADGRLPSVASLPAPPSACWAWAASGSAWRSTRARSTWTSSPGASTSPASARACGARLVTKADLFARADIVSIRASLSERTAGLVGAAELALLGPRGYLVNTSRGPIVDEAALVAALRDRVIAGAGLDVFATETLPAGHPLRSLPTTVITPHIGYVTAEGYRVFYRDIVADIAAWLDGSPLRVLN
jgi:phosphoglycerate dehydrogenase-like enzyme